MTRSPAGDEPAARALRRGKEARDMIRSLIAWAVFNPLVALLVAVALAGFGTYAFTHINVEAYPDPAPAILEVVAQHPGASAEEVERLVTIPLEVSLSGMAGLQSLRS